MSNFARNVEGPAGGYLHRGRETPLRPGYDAAAVCRLGAAATPPSHPVLQTESSLVLRPGARHGASRASAFGKEVMARSESFLSISPRGWTSCDGEAGCAGSSKPGAFATAALGPIHRSVLPIFVGRATRVEFLRAHRRNTLPCAQANDTSQAASWRPGLPTSLRRPWRPFWLRFLAPCDAGAPHGSALKVNGQSFPTAACQARRWRSAAAHYHL